MINRNRVVRALAGLVALGAVCGLSAATVPQLASADTQSVGDSQAQAQPSGRLTSGVLLTATDLTHAGWKVTETGAVDSDDGALLGQCAGPTPYLAHGFVEMKARGLYTGADDVNADGTEFVMAFKTNADARTYVDDYRAALEGRCLDLYGPKKWNVTSSGKMTLKSDHQHARIWTVNDHTAAAVRRSFAMVRVGDRVALVWLEGWNETIPAKSLNLHKLVQRAADRIET